MQVSGRDELIADVWFRELPGRSRTKPNQAGPKLVC
jgi:hypothetical protein